MVYKQQKKRSELNINLFEQVGKLVTPLVPSASIPSFTTTLSSMSSSNNNNNITSKSATKTFTATDFLDDLIDHSRTFSSINVRQSVMPSIEDYPKRNNNSSEKINTSTTETSDSELDSLLDDIDSLVVDLRGIEDNLRKSCVEILSPIDPPTSTSTTTTPSPPTTTESPPLVASPLSLSSEQPHTTQPKLISHKVSKSDPIIEFNKSEDEGGAEETPDNEPVPIVPKLLISRERIGNRFALSTSNDESSSSPNSSTTTTPCQTPDEPSSPNLSSSQQQQQQQQSPMYMPQQPSSSNSTTPISNSPSSSWRMGAVRNSVSPSVSPKLNSSGGGIPNQSGSPNISPSSSNSSLKNSGEMREKSWRKSNVWGPHPRSSTDPSSYFNRQSVVNIKPVDPSNSFSLKHRSTFPGSVQPIDQTPTSSGSNSPTDRSGIVISSPILTTTLHTPSNRTTVVFGERGLEYYNTSDLVNSKSHSIKSQKHQIHLDNPFKIKKLKDLLKSYNTKIITLINKISKEKEDWIELKNTLLAKYERRARLYREDCQIELMKVYREYYAIKTSIVDLHILISGDRIDNLKQKLMDISYLSRMMDEEASRKSAIVYSTFFVKTLDLLNHGTVNQKLLKLKKLTNYEKKVKHNYKSKLINYNGDSVEKRDRKLKEILGNAKHSSEFKVYYPWDQNIGVQSEFDKWMMDSRFMEGRQVRQLIDVVSEDCASERKIKPIDIDDFIVKFTENIITSYQLPPNHSIFDIPITNVVTQLIKRCLYPRMYSLIKIILGKCGTVIKFDNELHSKTIQLRSKSIKDLNLIPSNFPENYDWTNVNNPFKEAVSLLNDLTFHVVPTDIVSSIQQCIASLHTTSIAMINSCQKQKPMNAFNRAIGKGTFMSKVAIIPRDSFLLSSSSPSTTSHLVASMSREDSHSDTSSSSSSSPPTTPHKPGEETFSSHTDSIATVINHHGTTNSTMSADDLFPLFIYVLIQSDIIGYAPLVAAILENFSSELESSGEYGWCSVSFQAAISHLKQC